MAAQSDTPTAQGAETLEEHSLDGAPIERPVPGIVVIASGQTPMLRAMALEEDGVVLGRQEGSDFVLPDERVSREHARFRFEKGRWTVSDLSSRNGTFVDGVKVEGELTAPFPRVVRLGHTLVLCERDIRRFDAGRVSTDGELVTGPTLKAALDAVGRVAVAEDNLLISGESGSGKEVAARAFHAGGPHAQGPLVAVNCAAIPEGVAERLLFGAKRGAYSGATSDSEGYAQAAEGGVLFLDEIGDLELAVQPKLLRLLEQREVLALGAAVPRRVNVRICLATHQDLRGAVEKGTFRVDLYYRIAQPEVRMPSLRERPEEIPWLLVRELERVSSALVPHGRLTEACVLRHWPGNLREFRAEVRRAALAVSEAGERVVRAEHLSPTAGRKMGDEEARPEITTPVEITRERLEATLDAEAGNVASAARVLGLHRTQLYRLIKKLGIVVRDPS
jgi:DNA-binding NtrC family response regulator